MRIEKIKSPFDNLMLEVAVSEPKGMPKAIVQFSHGMCEHKERYFEFMNYLNDNGYVCVIHDHRGHGASVINEGEFGNFYTEDISAIIDDMHAVTEYIKNNYPNLPLYIFSHSMGTLVARNYMKKYEKEIDKIVLCGPPTHNGNASFGLFLSKILKPFYKEQAPNNLLNNGTFIGYNEKNAEPNSWITENKDNVRAYNEDELCGFVFTTNGFINLFKLQLSAFDSDDWEVYNKRLPIFVIAGENDPVIQSKKKFNALVDFLKELGYANISKKLYRNNRHEILNEKNKAEIYKDILNFYES